MYIFNINDLVSNLIIIKLSYWGAAYISELSYMSRVLVIIYFSNFYIYVYIIIIITNNNTL